MFRSTIKCASHDTDFIYSNDDCGRNEKERHAALVGINLSACRTRSYLPVDEDDDNYNFNDILDFEQVLHPITVLHAVERYTASCYGRAVFL